MPIWSYMFISTYIDLHIFDIDNSIRTSYRVTLSTFLIQVVFWSHPCIFQNMSFKNDVISFVTVPLPLGDNMPLLGEAFVPWLDLLKGIWGHLDLGRRRCQLWWDLSRTWRVQWRGVAQDGKWVSRTAELEQAIFEDCDNAGDKDHHDKNDINFVRT